MKRKPATRKVRQPVNAAPNSAATGNGELATGEPLADPRIRPLLERYCQLAGAKHAAISSDQSRITLPKDERQFFRDRASLRIAFSLAALERDRDAEIAVLGSPFLSQLIEAVRARGGRLSLGLITPVAPSPNGKGAELAIAVRDGTVKSSKTRVAVHPVGRLVVRVVLRAGAGVEEVVVESDVIDLSAGAKVSDEVAALFSDLESGRSRPGDPAAVTKRPVVPARQPADLLRLLLDHVREKSGDRVAERRKAAEQELAVELARLDKYFQSVLKDQSDVEAVEAITALAGRRRAEEVRRSQVKAVIHPLQLTEASVLVQRAEWQLESARGHRATFAAQRSLSGSAAWIFTCPQCGHPPAALVVCRKDHCACDTCAHRCSVCAEDFCEAHGILECRVDGQPVCEDHVRTCVACRLQYCTAHEGVCAEDGHAACSACLGPCASCGKVVCNRHAEQGRRRLCAACVRHCEGGDNELVGVDELAKCASCGKLVCSAHQAVCAVDGQVHCAQHLRRTETSRRLVCARHRATCTEESQILLASDEVAACASCGRLVCPTHSAECAVDQKRHCLSHLKPLADDNGALACPEHGKRCHVDEKTFRVASVSACPVCGKDACAAHYAACTHCGRRVCTADLNGPLKRCVTCSRLAVENEPPESVVAAAAVVKKGNGGTQSPRGWRIARDHTHLVVELDLGWKQKAVFTLRHGQNEPETVVKHSLLGSKRRR